jgi:hypothetical protein
MPRTIDDHNQAVSEAHGRYQTAFAASSTEAARKAARVQLYKDILASGRARGIKTGAYHALLTLGVDMGNSTGADV